MAPKTPKAHGILPVLAHFQFTNFIRTGTALGSMTQDPEGSNYTLRNSEKILLESSSEASIMPV